MFSPTCNCVFLVRFCFKNRAILWDFVDFVLPDAWGLPLRLEAYRFPSVYDRVLFFLPITFNFYLPHFPNVPHPSQLITVFLILNKKKTLPFSFLTHDSRFFFFFFFFFLFFISSSSSSSLLHLIFFFFSSSSSIFSKTLTWPNLLKTLSNINNNNKNDLLSCFIFLFHTCGTLYCIIMHYSSTI